MNSNSFSVSNLVDKTLRSMIPVDVMWLRCRVVDLVTLDNMTKLCGPYGIFAHGHPFIDLADEFAVALANHPANKVYPNEQQTTECHRPSLQRHNSDNL